MLMPSLVQRVRQTWNKYNLYNISRLKTPNTQSRTFFQQKWTAKAQARAYHGEHIREGQWTRMFSRYIPAVVPLDAAELAKDDGSIQGAGRGSGKDEKKVEEKKPEPTPYMGMTFYPQERRLDTAIFRAMFASSARQARQFVVHGFVKVNGKKVETTPR
jgi:ribosomal protein S4